MTSRAMPQCMACARFRSPFSDENTTGLTGPFCAAFPGGIPAEVFANRVDHRQPVAGDNGVRWTSLDGEEFPEWAFTEAVLGRGTA